MNTTAAAIQASVTVDTVRTWCRVGAVAAVKTAGRWVIDQASLAARIAIGKLKARKPAPRPVVYSVETMTAIGGSEWIRGDKHRVYINDWQRFAGIDVQTYGSGNVRAFSIGGRSVANSRAGRILGAIGKVYFDATDGQLYVQHSGADAVEVRYLDGERDTINLVQRLFAGIRTAIAAL